MLCCCCCFFVCEVFDKELWIKEKEREKKKGGGVLGEKGTCGLMTSRLNS